MHRSDVHVWDALTASVPGPLLSITWGLLNAINRPSLNAFSKAVARAYKGLEVSIATPQLRGWRLAGAYPLPEEKGRKKGRGARGCAEELESLPLQPQSWEGGVVTTSPLHRLTAVATSHSPSQWPWKKSSSKSGSPMFCQPQSQQQSQVVYLPITGCCSGQLPALPVPRRALAWVMRLNWTLFYCWCIFWCTGDL